MDDIILSTKEGKMVKILYPDKRIVSEDTIIAWANDYCIDNDIDPIADDDIYRAVDILSDSGEVTFAKDWQI